MSRNLSTASLARASARHPWRTIGAWLGVLVVAFALLSTLVDDALSTQTTLTNSPESAQGDALLRERLGQSSSAIEEVVVVRSATLTVDDPAFRAYVESLYAELTALGDDVIAGATHFYLTSDASLVSADRHTTIVPLSLPEGALGEVDQVHRVVDRASAGADSSFQVLITGEASVEAEVAKIAEQDLATGEAIGISAALVILALVFGALAAALLPIVLALAAIVVALGLATLVGQVMDLPFYVVNIMTMMGLAVGIDYSLFIVSRYREERGHGLEKVSAIAAAGATAGRTVVLSGMTVVLALTGLLITPDSANQAIAIGALLVVIIAVLASMTLLPALLSLMGDRINALRIPVVQRRASTEPADATGGFWYRTAGAVMRHPVVSLVLAGGVLVAAMLPAFDIAQGEMGVSALPDGLRSKEGFILLEEEFGFGQDLPAVIVIDGDPRVASVQAAIGRLEAALTSDPAFATVAVEEHPESNLAVLRARLAGDPVAGQAMDAVRRLRADHIPAAFNDVTAGVYVTGETAAFVDLAETTDTWTPIVFVYILSLSFVLLMVAFRSIVIPAKAILLNLLSVGATYGLLVLVFQKGIGNEFLGFQQMDVIQMGLPVFLFAVLFGLSMDYHVFLLSRVRERYVETGDNREAVAFGLRSTGRLITGAALIMVAVFGGFALGNLVALQQFGFGLAIAVLLDATIIRCIMVPASMRLLGDWNWYLPGFLRWLPDLRVDQPRTTEAPVTGD